MPKSNSTSATSRRNLLEATAGLGGMMVMAGCGDSGDSSGDGTEVSTTFHTYNTNFDPTQYDMYTLIIDELESVGVDVEHVTGSFPKTVTTTLREHDFQMFPTSIGASLSRLDPDEFLYDFLHSDNVETSNFTEFSNDDNDEAVRAQQRELDREKRREHVYEAQRIQVEQAPLITFAATSTASAHRSDRFRDPTLAAGLGMLGFWNHLQIEPVNDASRFKIVKSSDVANLNPLFGPSLDLWTYALMYDRLMRYDPESLQPKPWVAESVETKDETTVDVTLQDDLSWHDGETLTAEDVKFTYEYLQQYSPTYGSQVEVIDSVETSGETDLTFSLKRPYAPIFGRVFASVPLLPEHVWSKVPAEVDVDSPTDWQNPDPIGSGPFKFESWRRQEELRLTRFDDYFEPANVEAVSHLTASDVSGAARLLEGGRADALGLTTVPPSSIDRLKETENVSVETNRTHGPTLLSFQTNRLPGSDPAFRRAVAHLIPRKNLVETVLNGYGTVENGSIITSGNDFWHNPDLPERRYDPEKARQILRDAGYSWDDEDDLMYPDSAATETEGQE